MGLKPEIESHRRELNPGFNSHMYLKISEYSRAILSYLVLGNHLKPERAVRLSELERKVKAIRKHVNRTMLYRTLKQMRDMGLVSISRASVKGINLGSYPNAKSSYTSVYAISDNFREILTEWCITLGYEGFRDFLHKNGYPHAFNVVKCCRIMTDGYTYVQERRLKNANLAKFASR